ncbi:pleckstrin homology domain-containing family A member 7 isoform X5 [Danaus plexippus]|uniref:pleckstrin homology domain-containing family A member 7 isoform X5 n=1 Tax=Danaus plexippus TaxID=13037 RepID=UPI002AAF74F9|nr:pleckstrin homology domain-containing family A member 7 isoform X5 [Danaus plexippus]
MNLAVRFDEENMPAPASCMSAEHGCVMFDCLVHLWEWIDPPVTQTDYQMENKKNVTATQQPVTQQHLMAHHVHPDQIYSPQQTQLPTLVNNQAAQIQQNGVMHQLLQSQYHSNMNARSPLLENKHEMYGTGHNHDYVRHYGANDNYNYPQSPPRIEKTEIHTDHNVNHELLQNMPKGYNAEVYQDYMKRNPPKDTNQIYQNHQPMYRPNMNQYGSKPYLPYSNRIGPQSNTELLRRQYNEIQQMKMQQQMHYQNQAQMHQQQKFAERQLLLQQIHGVQPPPNLQNSIYSDSSYRDLDRYSSKNDFKEYSSNDIQRDMERYAKNYDYNDMDIQNRQYQESQWQTNHNDYRESERQRQYSEHEKSKSQSPPSDYSNQKTNSGVVSPMKSSESSTPSIKSPSSDSRRSSSGTQALRSPTAQRIPSAPVSMSGMLYKQGSDGLKVWRKRWFVLSEYCLFYYKSQDEEKLLGSVLLPSYKVSACSAEDKVMRKFAFKLEHANMRTYVLAALDQEAMMKWVKALTMAALMQNTNEQKQNDRSAKSEESNEEAGPTYANAPPKPRRSNDGYNSPSPDMYDPNYDLLRKPASQYSQGTSNTRTNYIQETYRSPQNPLQSPYQTKRSYDMQQLSLPLTNTTDNSDNQNTSVYKSNPQSPYDNRLRNQHTKEDEEKIESLYDKKPNYNPFLQDYSGQERKSQENEDVSRVTADMSKTSIYSEHYSDNRSIKSHDPNVYNREMYGDINMKSNKTNANMNERTPETYGRPNASAYSEKIGDYEDIYSAYNNDSGKIYPKSPNPSQSRDTVSLSSHKSPQEQNTNYVQEKTFSGPSVLRRKKMQASGIQPTMPRPHSADFLEYESKNEALNNSVPVRKTNDQTKQPQRPKSSLDINSYYDPSSDKYYSEESYAEKMRQSAQYLQQQNMGPKNIRIPLEKYASGLAEKQLHSPYNQNNNNNYETEFNVNRTVRDHTNYASTIQDREGMNSNWTLKEKDLENQKEYLNRSGSVMSDGSNVSAIIKDSRFDPSSEGFMRSASARLPSERDRDKKVQQREESMKRLLEWKQRMLQSPLTRKSTPATISLARSLNQSRQSLRSDQYKPKTYKNASYNSYSSDDEASMTMSGTNIETGPNNNNNNQHNQTTLSNKPFLGSNTSIGRTNRDGNIPVRAVSPRVRWVEDKHNEEYGSQQLTTSQHNLNNLNPSEEGWSTVRSPSRVIQQPIRAVSPRVRRNTENDELRKDNQELGEVPTAGELLGRSHEELVLLLIQLRRRHAATHRSIEQCCAQISSIEDCMSSLKAMEREESLQRLEHLKMQLMDLESQYEKSKPLVQLVDNMVKLGSLYNRPGSTIERLERNQRLRQKVLAEHALEQQRWLESAAAGKALETEAARVRVSELWALEQELADEAAILQGLKTDKDAIDSLLTGVRSKLTSASASQPGLEVELARVHAMLAHNSKVYKKLEQTVADNARLERELHHLRRALRAQRANTQTHAHPTAMLEDEVSRVQHLVSALQRQRQELSRAVRHLTQQSHVLQTTHDSTGKRRPMSSWQETNLDTGHTIDHGHSDYDYEPSAPLQPPGHYGQSMETPLYVDTRSPGMDVASPINSEDMHHTAFGNLTNVEKQEIKTVRIVKRESERRQRDRERSLQPMSDWSANNITANIDQFLEEELVQPINNYRASSLPRTDYSKYEEYYSKPQNQDQSPYIRINDKNMDQSPKYPSSPSLSNYDYSRDISSLSSSYHRSYDKSGYDRTNSLSTQYLNTPTDSARTLTNDPISKTSSMASLTRSNIELSPIFKSEAAKQIITEMSSDAPKNGTLHRRQVPKEKRRHYTAPHHLSAKTLNEMPKDVYNQDALGRSLDDADMERALRTGAPDVVRSALPRRVPDSIDQLLAAPQKIIIPERYIPEKPPELSPEEQQKRQEKVESIKKMLTGSSADPSKSPDGEDKRQREHLLQMNQLLARQVTEMSKIIAVKALEELPTQNNDEDYEDRSPDVELPIYQQRYNFFT